MQAQESITISPEAHSVEENLAAEGHKCTILLALLLSAAAVAVAADSVVIMYIECCTAEHREAFSKPIEEILHFYTLVTTWVLTTHKRPNFKC